MIIVYLLYLCLDLWFGLGLIWCVDWWVVSTLVGCFMLFSFCLVGDWCLVDAVACDVWLLGCGV